MNGKKLLSLLLALVLAVSLLSGLVWADDETSALAEQFAGKQIGVVTGSIFDQLALKYIPDCTIVYFNSNADLALALENGKIDAYTADEPAARVLTETYAGQEIVGMLEPCPYGYFFYKDDARLIPVREQMDEFLTRLRADGTLAEIDELWFGHNDSKKSVDTDSLTGENGTLRMAVSSDVGIPFVYYVDGQLMGYDVDIAVRFCREYGYKLELTDSTPGGMLAAVASGKSDFGGSTVCITEERKEIYDFSEPNYEGGVVLVGKKETTEAAGAGLTLSDPALLEAVNGCRLGVLTGSVQDVLAAELLPDCEVIQYSAMADLALALDIGKIDAYMMDEPIARIVLKAYPEQSIYAVVSLEDDAFIFPKDEAGEALREQFNAFLAEITADGTRQRIEELWFGDDEEKQVVDTSGLTGENGTLTMGISTSIGAPFCYMKDGALVGYDLDMAVRFCREYGYALEFADAPFSGMIAGVTTGMYDFAGSCVIVTEERKQAVNFSEPNYSGGSVIVIRDSALASADGEDDTDDAEAARSRFAEGFEKTFIRESRWKLFVSGIGTTLLITLLAALFGSLIGFGVYLLYRKQYRPLNAVVNAISDVFGKTPVVVILMILYYVIFGRSSLSGTAVSVIGFTCIFACSVTALMDTAAKAVDGGQMEAALALGYSDTKAFLRIIFPQALQHFLPGYRSELVTLIKGTAIVGYIAVQDLTKVSDIIRSRTYEAFFPLIVSAVIYFIIAWLLSRLVSGIGLRLKPEHRKPGQILKGVQTK